MNQTLTDPSFLLRFEKKGPIRFISHLDLIRHFHRAFLRAKIEMKFSEGFSPHPKFALALPLSVGVESECEWAAFTLKAESAPKPEEIRRRLQEQMPAGILLTRVIPQEEKITNIAYASYRIRLPYGKTEALAEIRRLCEEKLTVSKKNKKGKWVEKDVSAGIRRLQWEEKDGAIQAEALLSAAGEAYLKPETLLQALTERKPDLDVTGKKILRVEVYREDLTPFCENTNASKGKENG